MIAATPKQISLIKSKGLDYKTIHNLRLIWQIQLKRINHKQNLQNG